MKCSECGSEIVPGEKFCGNCGAPVEGAMPAGEDEQESPARDETVIAETPAVPPIEPDEPSLPELDEDLPPPPPPPPPLEPAQGRDNKRTWIIVAVVAILLILCCCCVVILGSVFWEDIADAVEGMAEIVPTLIDASASV
jgi:hypothetical protein